MAGNRTKRDIKARFIREKNVFENQELETRVIIGIVRLIERDQEGREITTEEVQIKGEASAGALKSDLEYRFFGKWITHHLYGDQFHYESFVVDKPATKNAVVAYLRQCKGVGAVRAGLLFDKYGEASIDKLIASPDEVAREVKGLKPEDCREAAAVLAKTEHIRKSKLDLISVLHGKGFPRKTIDSILRDYGAEAAAYVRRNPYILMRYRGCGFLKTDKLYLEQGHDPARLKRQSLCAWHAIAKASDGDTWFPKTTAIKAIRQNVAGVETDRIDRAILLAMKAEMLKTRIGEVGTLWIAEGKKAAQEERVARLVIQAMQEATDDPEFVAWPDVDGLKLYPHQKEQLAKALHGFIAILAGSPGTGKTHSVAELLKEIIATHGIENVAACAPTGKAAVRMSEAFEKARIPLRATTTHSLLGVLSAEDGWMFEHNETNPLPHKFIVVDETSMKDVPLFGSLLAARGLHAHVLFVGDTNQLSPVGHGAPLRDLIAAGVPCGALTEIQRTSGRIVQACAEIRDHKRFTPSPSLDLDSGENLLVIETDDPDRQIETMEGLIERLKASEKYDPVWDIQILCAVNKKTSPLNRSELNRKLQQQLNPHGRQIAGNPFRVGDKVICLKNGSYESAVKTRTVRGRWEIVEQEREYYDDPVLKSEPVAMRFKSSVFVHDPDGPSTCMEEIGKQYVANGEQGEVLTVDAARFVVRLANPDREVIVFRAAKGDKDESGDSSDSSDAEEKSGTGCDWDLGYAISVHKSQGSEWPVVVVILDDSGAAKQVCSRNWLFTAISRAKTMCLMIGKRAAALQMCRRDGLHRKTFLKELILEGMQSSGLTFPGDHDAGFTWTDEIVSQILEGVV